MDKQMDAPTSNSLSVHCCELSWCFRFLSGCQLRHAACSKTSTQGYLVRFVGTHKRLRYLEAICHGSSQMQTQTARPVLLGSLTS